MENIVEQKAPDKNLKEQSEFRKRTMEEQQLENAKTKRNSNLIIRLIRMIRDNPDLVLISIIVGSVFITGYLVCRIYLGMTVKDITLHAEDFILFVIAIVGSATSLVGKLFVQQGVISKKLSGVAKRESDATGRSIIKEE